MGLPNVTTAAPSGSGPRATTPPRVLPTSEHLTARLGELAAQANIPGASIAVRLGDKTVTAATGVLDAVTGYPATTDSIFQIGSITKVWTATLIMQLVDEGVIELDAPVRTYLPEFRVVDEAATKSVTIRQLLCHTGGFEGDVFEDHGPGDDAVERLVAALATVAPQIHAPGEMFSYANSGYVVLGRVVEVLTGQTWEAALRERVVAALDLGQVATSPDEAILHRVAMGHAPDPEGGHVKTPWAMPRSNAPAGSTLATTAAELLAFAAAHAALGLLPDGTRLLSEASARAMCEPQIPVPGRGLLGKSWGLGWILYDWPGGPVIGHDGGTIGQRAMLRIAPEHGLSIAILTNGGDLYALQALVREVFADLADIEVPRPPTPPADPAAVDPRFFTGRYSSEAAMIDIVETETENGFTITTRPRGAVAAMVGNDTAVTTAVVALDERTLIATTPQGGVHTVYAFIGDQDRARYVHAGRATRRSAPTGTEQAAADLVETGPAR